MPRITQDRGGQHRGQPAAVPGHLLAQFGVRATVRVVDVRGRLDGEPVPGGQQPDEQLDVLAGLRWRTRAECGVEAAERSEGTGPEGHVRPGPVRAEFAKQVCHSAYEVEETYPDVHL